MLRLEKLFTHIKCVADYHYCLQPRHRVCFQPVGGFLLPSAAMVRRIWSLNWCGGIALVLGIASPQKSDPGLSGLPSGQGTGDGHSNLQMSGQVYYLLGHQRPLMWERIQRISQATVQHSCSSSGIVYKINIFIV
ncbi:hypothetical protein PoB_003927300 [Plakobranchus ocellatus]|uniref:Uncharacterized protein n=1 Tax=Plakobranchus ocellatus TaxID=259542 RepID=A0AAV4B101_9GAST|nr:hypothetical protein PoB_003927300 [Plakobranchus ocellatus]